MAQALVYTLLALALLLPLLGAVALRGFGARMSDIQIAGAAALVMAVAIGSTFALARGNVDRLQIGNLALLLPIASDAPPIADLPIPDDAQPTPTAPATQTPRVSPSAATPTASVTPTLAIAPSIMPTATLTPTIAATATLTPTLAPTATLTPTATLAPTDTPAPQPTAAPAPPQPRKYTVQPGDTIRSIAERFSVTVAALLRANNLTPAQADTIRPGQVLTIPPSGG